MKEWPSIRQCPRFRLDIAVNVISPRHGTVRGWCHDISQGGMCGNVPSLLSIGDQVTLDFQLPKSNQVQRIAAKVCYARGFRYGFVFTDLDPSIQKRIADFGVEQRTSAFILSANSPMVWIVHRMLQQLGLSQVRTGSPKIFPLESPHLIIIDSDWPDFAEVISFVRSEAGASPIAIVAVLSPTTPAGEAHRAGADLVLHKPLALDRTRKVLELAFQMITGTVPPEPVAQLSGTRGKLQGRLR